MSSDIVLCVVCVCLLVADDKTVVYLNPYLPNSSSHTCNETNALVFQRSRKSTLTWDKIRTIIGYNRVFKQNQECFGVNKFAFTLFLLWCTCRNLNIVVYTL